MPTTDYSSEQTGARSLLIALLLFDSSKALTYFGVGAASFYCLTAVVNMAYFSIH